MENNTENLDNNKTDYFASVAKAAFGAVPFVGSFLGELVGQVVPNQRIDRLAKYIKILDEKVSKISSEKMKELIQDDEFVSLVEESFIQASRATTDERREYIASIIANGISNEDISFQESKYLLRLLQELNDVEIIWLRFYLNPSMGGDDKFRTQHKNILQYVFAYMGSDESIWNKAALQKSYQAHLAQLHLLDIKYKTEFATNAPRFGSNGEQEIESYSINTLGIMLLKNINLYTKDFK